jgi:protein-tyrosine-phosphatase
MATYIENLDANIGLTEGNLEELSGTSDEYIKSRIADMASYYIKIHAPWYEGTPEYHQVYSEVYNALMSNHKNNS